MLGVTTMPVVPRGRRQVVLHEANNGGGRRGFGFLAISLSDVLKPTLQTVGFATDSLGQAGIIFQARAQDRDRRPTR